VRRFALIALLLVPACRRTHKPLVDNTPSAPPNAAAPDLSSAKAAPEPPPWWAQEDAATSGPPTAAEIRAQLDPLLPELKGCIKQAGPFDAGTQLELRVKLDPIGAVADATVLGAPAARTCTVEVLRKLRMPGWRGPSTAFSVPLLSTGDPIVPVGDAG
jgi:hypothetical protein